MLGINSLKVWLSLGVCAICDALSIYGTDRSSCRQRTKEKKQTSITQMTYPSLKLLLSLLQLKANRKMQDIASRRGKKKLKGNYAGKNPKLSKKNPKIVALIGYSTLAALLVVLLVALSVVLFPI